MKIPNCQPPDAGGDRELAGVGFSSVNPIQLGMRVRRWEQWTAVPEWQSMGSVGHARHVSVDCVGV
jgi:hypothetical protein